MEKYIDNKTTSKYGIKYTQEFKEYVCKSYLQDNRTKRAIWRELVGGEAEHGNLLKWLRELGYIDRPKRPSFTFTAYMNKKAPSQLSPQELEKKVEELQKLLEDSQLKNQMYQRMIDLAEEELKINIQKKFDTR